MLRSPFLQYTIHVSRSLGFLEICFSALPCFGSIQVVPEAVLFRCLFRGRFGRILQIIFVYRLSFLKLFEHSLESRGYVSEQLDLLLGLLRGKQRSESESY